MSLPQEEQYYTYADYCSWDDGARWELIDGEAYAMVPAPSTEHQSILMELSTQFGSYLKGKRCKVFAAPFDVRLNADTDDNIVVQPDLVVVCDPAKLDDKGCKGAPDMVLEILSPYSLRHDRFVKFQLYQKVGIREYWIVDPAAKIVSIYILENGQYYITNYSDTDSAPVHVLEDCIINLNDVFPVQREDLSRPAT